LLRAPRTSTLHPPRGSREPHLITLAGRCQSTRWLVDVALGRFEEARAAARAHRANGSEMMRFQCYPTAVATGDCFGAPLLPPTIGPHLSLQWCRSREGRVIVRCGQQGHAGVPGASGRRMAKTSPAGTAPRTTTPCTWAMESSSCSTAALCSPASSSSTRSSRRRASNPYQNHHLLIFLSLV
jgi:hypothetical protein